MNKIKLRVDSRDKIHENKFGQVIIFPDEISYDTALYDEVQPVGDVSCTCYTTCDIAEDQENKTFDIGDLWNRIPQTPQGADPREVLKEAVTNGLLVQGETERRKDWSSYWRADLGAGDAFDNVRSSIFLAQSPVGCATYWYDNWPSGETLPIGGNPTSGHMYSIEGWKQINGQPHFIIEAWIGQKLYMSREVFNKAMKPYGMSSWVLSTSLVDAKKTKTLLETIVDLLKNIIIRIKELTQTTTQPAIVQPQPTQPPETVNQSSPDNYNEVKNALLLYKWGNPVDTRHSVRVICDEQGLTVDEKNLICAVIQAESNFDCHAVNNNYKNGKIVSTDYGLCQINDYYWIGLDEFFASVNEVYEHPEKSVKFMIDQYRQGHLDWWIAYKNNSYKKYLP